ncbi:hypothetical protein GCG21_14170 [Pseudactinotalea sp. HY160]|uniref:hypothetical protein n=1 Tax=Pseudactinotalea sp. HY160 TaxID=2654490 RepID=UPI00128C4AEA|nr:hypothetical protein [Pseudactinotalea sp. HY160]MPV51130.1 hypothetical protein [Pseudactinotalea sp. HY160]
MSEESNIGRHRLLIPGTAAVVSAVALVLLGRWSNFVGHLLTVAAVLASLALLVPNPAAPRPVRVRRVSAGVLTGGLIAAAVWLVVVLVR